jgi:hypothetical protein
MSSIGTRWLVGALLVAGIIAAILIYSASGGSGGGVGY